MVLALIALALLAFVGWGWAARTGAAIVEHRVAYAYTVPAMIGMFFLAVFPFFYTVVLSLTNSNIYNTDQTVFENWVGLDNFIDIVADFHVLQRTAEGLVWNYQNFYWTLGFTVVFHFDKPETA